MTTNTLTSLAILNVQIDHGGDYLEYLRPFILQVLSDHDIEPISTGVVRRLIREQFGLEIPERTVEIVLKRLAKRHVIKKDNHVYRKTGVLPDPQVNSRRAEAARHIESLVYGLRKFSQGTITPLDNDNDAIDAICSFLAEFDVILFARIFAWNRDPATCRDTS